MACVCVVGVCLLCCASVLVNGRCGGEEVELLCFVVRVGVAGTVFGVCLCCGCVPSVCLLCCACVFVNG